MFPAIGYALREQNRLVVADEASINGVEITFEQVGRRINCESYLAGTDFDYVSLHTVTLAPAGELPPSTAQLDALFEFAEANKAHAISDHLGIARPAGDTCRFDSIAWTAENLSRVCRNIETIQDRFGTRPFYLETIAHACRMSGTMSEAEFLRGIFARTGCGWLLDVANIYANALNFRFDPYAFIAEVVPSVSRIQLHLAGGYYDEDSDRYVDSHSHAVPDPVWDLYRFALRQTEGKLDAIFIERDQNFPDEAGWRAEIRKARRLAELIVLPRVRLARSEPQPAGSHAPIMVLQSHK